MKFMTNLLSLAHKFSATKIASNVNWPHLQKRVAHSNHSDHLFYFLTCVGNYRHYPVCPSIVCELLVNLDWKCRINWSVGAGQKLEHNNGFKCEGLAYICIVEYFFLLLC